MLPYKLRWNPEGGVPERSVLCFHVNLWGSKVGKFAEGMRCPRSLSHTHVGVKIPSAHFTTTSSGVLLWIFHRGRAEGYISSQESRIGNKGTTAKGVAVSCFIDEVRLSWWFTDLNPMVLVEGQWDTPPFLPDTESPFSLFQKNNGSKERITCIVIPKSYGGCPKYSRSMLFPVGKSSMDLPSLWATWDDMFGT